MLSKSVKNYTRVMKMFFSCLQENDYVIKVNEAVCQLQLPEAILH